MSRRPAAPAALFLTTLACLCGAAPAAGDDVIPAHPQELKYGDLKFEVPEAGAYVHHLKNGSTVYLAEDHALPLITLSVTARTGSFLEPAGKVGLAGLTGTMMRAGGAGSRTAEAFDEQVDYLAANISSYIGNTRGRASVNCITQAMEDCIDLFFEMMKSPRFQEDRLEVEKENLREELKQRNDSPQTISSREWDWLLHGRNHFSSRRMTLSDLEAITREDLVRFHARYFRPDQMMFAVSGDLDTESMLAELNRRMSGWKVDGAPIPWPPPAPVHRPVPGLYHSEKDIPQGRVLIGHPGIQRKSWEDRDEFPLIIMNNILGGGGFTSRLLKRVRSDEGLAYSAGSAYTIGDYWPGTFLIFFQSKSRTVAQAAKISIEEMKKIREEPVSDEELRVARNYYVDTFPRRFESKAATVSTFVSDDYIGRPHSYWSSYRENIRKVSRKDVQRVARKYLHPDQLLYLVVGKWEEIGPGDPDGKASMKEIGGGHVRHLPVRDPLTLEPVKE
ncbi:MAG: M16 family metallopeptidase [Acidobacteriota bacterium]